MQLRCNQLTPDGTQQSELEIMSDIFGTRSGYVHGLGHGAKLTAPLRFGHAALEADLNRRNYRFQDALQHHKYYHLNCDLINAYCKQNQLIQMIDELELQGLGNSMTSSSNRTTAIHREGGSRSRVTRGSMDFNNKFAEWYHYDPSRRKLIKSDSRSLVEQFIDMFVDEPKITN
ncbi:hypothetical protein QJS10_CPA07g00500 [Acorus calamus]|uniref:Uncharacterized protein n=1 Tax=Acorus calamus TaxID=4465 RepID=A0AAV9EEG6_ACOCL|nr:hypothetical protein QJS10_CPA07g00500 [Acorus calamus]